MMLETIKTSMPVIMPAFWKRTGKVSIAPPIMEFSKVKIVVMELF